MERHDAASTLGRHCINVVCLLGAFAGYTSNLVENAVTGLFFKILIKSSSCETSDLQADVGNCPHNMFSCDTHLGLMHLYHCLANSADNELLIFFFISPSNRI